MNSSSTLEWNHREVLIDRFCQFQASIMIHWTYDFALMLQVDTYSRACASVYPSFEQNKILWVWPNTDPRYKNIAERERPPYIEELDDPSYTSIAGMRDFPYGYNSFSRLNSVFQCFILLTLKLDRKIMSSPPLVIWHVIS